MRVLCCGQVERTVCRVPSPLHPNPELGDASHRAEGPVRHHDLEKTQGINCKGGRKAEKEEQPQKDVETHASRSASSDCTIEWCMTESTSASPAPSWQLLAATASARSASSS